MEYMFNCTEDWNAPSGWKSLKLIPSAGSWTELATEPVGVLVGVTAGVCVTGGVGVTGGVEVGVNVTVGVLVGVTGGVECRDSWELRRRR